MGTTLKTVNKNPGTHVWSTSLSFLFEVISQYIQYNYNNSRQEYNTIHQLPANTSRSVFGPPTLSISQGRLPRILHSGYLLHPFPQIINIPVHILRKKNSFSVYRVYFVRIIFNVLKSKTSEWRPIWIGFRSSRFHFFQTRFGNDVQMERHTLGMKQ
jgi:hypothetical protein